MSTNQHTLLFESSSLPFVVQNTINWRGIEFHLRIDANATHTGGEFMVIVNFNDKRYFHRTVSSRGWLFSKGHFPEIETKNHTLKFSLGKVPFKSFKLSDEMKSNTEIEDTLESPFKISGVPLSVHFNNPKEKIEVIPEKKINNNEVVLYEYKSMELNINSYAYFENENLIIDYWKLGGNYEDEIFITIENQDIVRLYKEFNVDADTSIKRELLLQSILKAFNGESCFRKIEKFLIEKNIPHSKSARR